MPKEDPTDLVAQKNPKGRVLETGRAAADREGDKKNEHGGGLAKH